MKYNYYVLNFFTVLYLACACKIETHQSELSTVSIVCLKENDTLNIKITNHTGKTIYIPKEYEGCYTVNSDTLYLETTGKTEFGTDYYYRYKDIFSFEFFTTKKIAGHVPDSVEKHVNQVYFFNQFRLQPILPLSIDSSYTMKLQFNVPKYANTIRAVYYYKPFLNKERLEKFDYFLDDFLKFDSLNANHVVAPIYIRYR
jgi:hypothetical protein